MDPISIIKKYAPEGSHAFSVLAEHGEAVAAKARELSRAVPDLQPDPVFIEEAAMLHDIGILLTDEPRLGCHGNGPYICHGVLGRKILEDEGLSRHALVCERHIGVGLTHQEIKRQQLPLPMRDMLPMTIEEKIVCLADKFFSKKHGSLSTEKPLEAVRREVGRYGPENLKRLEELLALFSR